MVGFLSTPLTSVIRTLYVAKFSFGFGTMWQWTWTPGGPDWQNLNGGLKVGRGAKYRRTEEGTHRSLVDLAIVLAT